MKLKATLTLIAASLFLAACDQSGSRLCTVRQKHHLALARHW